MDSLMDEDGKPSLGFAQPAIGTDWAVCCQKMATRKSKKDKGGGLMRPIVAENLKRQMHKYFKDKPHITNRALWLAEKAELGLGTIQRTLSGETGASIDTLEALAKILGIAPFEFLIPSQETQRLLAAPAEETEELHRLSSGNDARDPTIRHR